MSRITYSDMVEMAREAVSWEVRDLAGGTGSIDSLYDAALESIRQGVDASLIYTTDIVATWESLGYPDLPEGLADLDADLSGMVCQATYWELVEGEGMGPDAAWDGLDEALARRAREHAADTDADDVDDYLYNMPVPSSDLREALWEYLNGGDVEDLRDAIKAVNN